MDQKRCFTLIELLIVIAIIAVLAAMLLPSLNKSREKAREIQCGGNIKQSGTALILYSEDYPQYLPQYTGVNTDPQYAKWQDMIYGYVYPGQYGSKVVPANNFYLDGYVPKGIFRCPAQRDTSLASRIKHYGINLYVSSDNSGCKRSLKRIRKPSELLMVSDCDRVNPADPYVSNDYNFIGFRHSGAANNIFIDNHVERRMARDISIITSAISNPGYYYWGQFIN